jgi:hypothetical protein
LLVSGFSKFDYCINKTTRAISKNGYIRFRKNDFNII